jgi:hypothetical protein
MNIARLPALITTALIMVTLVGCARFPSQAPTTGKQLVLTMRVRGRITPTDPADPSIKHYYFIAIDNDNNQYTGPWAVAGPPYGGTGWLTAQDAQHSVGATSFIQYDSANPDGYIYSILPGSNFLNTSSPQLPIRTELLDGGSTLRFTIDFSQIATTAIPADQIEQLDINFITTNVLAVDPNAIYERREWDALGYSGKNYVTIDTTLDRTYYDDNLESHPVADPDIAIVSWSAQVQTVSSR